MSTLLSLPTFTICISNEKVSYVIFPWHDAITNFTLARCRCCCPTLKHRNTWLPKTKDFCLESFLHILSNKRKKVTMVTSFENHKKSFILFFFNMFEYSRQYIGFNRSSLRSQFFKIRVESREKKQLIWWQVWCSSIRVDQFRTIKGYKCLFFPLGWAATAATQPKPSLGRQNPQFIHYAKYAMPPSAKANIIISSSAWKKSIRQETNAHFQWDFLLRAAVKKRTAKVSCFQLIQNFYFLKDILSVIN